MGENRFKHPTVFHVEEERILPNGYRSRTMIISRKLALARVELVEHLLMHENAVSLIPGLLVRSPGCELDPQ